MKKKKKRSGKNKAQAAPVAPISLEDEGVSRRDILRRYRNRSIGLGLVGVAGWLIVDDVQATAREHDLTRIGNGTPTVVQIHDPNCAVCAALQKESRAAIKGLAPGPLQFLVANIRDSRGRKLATDNGVGHVTLLLFDGEGKRRDILRGSRDRTELEPIFQRFANRHGS